MSATLPPWDQLSFTFAWDSSLIASGTVPQCMNVTFSYWNALPNALEADPPPSVPYSAVLYAGGFQPHRIPMNNSEATGRSPWIANLPLGPEFAVSMKDAKNYTGGVLEKSFKMSGGSGCDLTDPLKPSSLNVSASGAAQCGRAILSINQGTAPYTVEVVPINMQQKTMHFASSPFNFVLDMGEGVQYYLAVYDAAGRSAVLGPYNITASSDNSCLGTATTVTVGRFSTLYPGGTAISSATPTRTSSAAASTGSNSSSTRTVVVLGVGIPVVIIIVAAILLWLWYKRSRRPRELPLVDYPDFDPPHATQANFAPVAIPYHLNPTGQPHSDSNHSFPAQHFPMPHPIHSVAADRQTIRSTGEASANASANASEPPSTSSSEKRRQLFNPDVRGLGAVEVEPFDPSTIGRVPTPEPESNLPPLPPAYSAS